MNIVLPFWYLKISKFLYHLRCLDSHLIFLIHYQHESNSSNQLADKMKKLVSLFCHSYDVVLIASAASEKHAIHKSLITSHTFDSFVHISAPNKTQRLLVSCLYEANIKYLLLPRCSIPFCDKKKVLI
jgi:hypothetical protein